MRLATLIAGTAGGMIVCAILAYKVHWIFIVGIPGSALTTMTIASLIVDPSRRDQWP